MSGPQFVHLETYSRSVSKVRRGREAARAEDGRAVERKLSVEEICGEAARTPGFHPHIDDPTPPTLIYGISPDQVPAIIETRVAEVNAKIRTEKSGHVRGEQAKATRAIRKDTHVLFTMVTSYPVPWFDDGTGRRSLQDPAERKLYEQWAQRDLEWAKSFAVGNGLELLSSVGHTDEEYPHNHHLAVGEGPRLEARACHPGYVAKGAVEPLPGEEPKQTKKRADNAYVSAMRAFQDDYFAKVGFDAGLTRTGPRRRRLPRATWHHQKSAAKEVGEANLRSAELAKKSAGAKTRLEELEVASTRVADEIGARAATLVEAAKQKAEIEGLADKAAISANENLRQSQDLETEIAKQRVLLSDLREDREAGERERSSVASVLASEIAALRVAQKHRLEAEAAAAAAVGLEKLLRTAAATREENLRARERDAIFEAENLGRRERDLHDRAIKLAARESEADAILEGIVAFSDGRLLYDPAKSEKPFSIRSSDGDSHLQLRERLAPVRGQLVPIIERIDRSVKLRSSQMSRAITTALSAWSSGLLAGLGDPLADGRPSFQVPRDAEGDALMKIIQPFRSEVAHVVGALPDRGLIASILATANRLRRYLSKAEQESEADLVAQLTKMRGRSTERGA